MRIKNGKQISSYYEDYKPLERRRNNLKIAGWTNQAKSGASLEWDGTYNDHLAGVQMAGETQQTVTVQGKNIFDKSAIAARSVGASKMETDTGVRMIASYAGGPYYQVFNLGLIRLFAGKTVRFSADITSNIVQGGGCGFYVGALSFNPIINIVSWIHDTKLTGTHTIPTAYATSDEYIGLLLNASRNTAISQPGDWIQYDNLIITVDQEDTSYESYVHPSPTPSHPSPLRICGGDPDASGASVIYGGGHLWVDEDDKLAIPALHAVIVPNDYAGYTYIGTDGKRRAADTWNPVTGKVTRRIALIASYDGETVTTPYMSTTGALTTGAAVLYVLDTPVVTYGDPAQLPTYPHYTALTQDGAVGGWLTASAKVMD